MIILQTPTKTTMRQLNKNINDKDNKKIHF